MTENFPNLVKERDTQAQDTQGIPNAMNQKKQTPRHILIKRPKKKREH